MAACRFLGEQKSKIKVISGDYVKCAIYKEHTKCHPMPKQEFVPLSCKAYL